MNGFHLYYLDSNGGTEIRSSSARGSMTFPEENQWITLTEEEYWSESTASWKPWLGSGIMYAKYNFVDDQLHMTVLLDMTDPADTAEYTWDFVKVDDTVDPWW